MTFCPCGSYKPEEICCRPIVSGLHLAETAVALMRSRYSAFFWGDRAHLVNTQSRALPPVDKLDPEIIWTGLTILNVDKGNRNHDVGSVSFEARYNRNGQPFRLTERSLFEKIGGKWYYTGADKG